MASGHNPDFRLGALALALGHGDDEWMLGVDTAEDSGGQTNLRTGRVSGLV